MKFMTITIMISAFGMIVTIGATVGAITTVFYTPPGFVWLLFTIFLGMLITSFSQIQAIKVSLPSWLSWIDVSRKLMDMQSRSGSSSKRSTEDDFSNSNKDSMDKLSMSSSQNSEGSISSVKGTSMESESAV